MTLIASIITFSQKKNFGKKNVTLDPRQKDRLVFTSMCLYQRALSSITCMHEATVEQSHCVFVSGHFCGFHHNLSDIRFNLV